MTANLFKEEIGKLFPALGQLDAVGITDEMWRRIGHKDGRYASAIYEALMAEMTGIANGTFLRIASDATVEELLVTARANVPFTRLSDEILDLVKVDLELVRGKELQVFMHKFDRPWYPATEGRALQRSLGFDGNAAAYLAWLSKTRHSCESLTIPENNARLYSVDGASYTPYYRKYDDFCDLGSVLMNADRNTFCILVSFRPSPFF